MEQSPVETNEHVQRLAPRVAADLFIDGELKSGTLRRRHKNATRSFVGGILVLGFWLHSLMDMIVDGDPLARIGVQFVLLAVIGFLTHQALTQRRILEKLLQELPPEDAP